MAILLPTVFLSNMGMSAIRRHAPNETSRKKALAQSKYALPFWSFVISIGVLRSTRYYLGIVLSPILSPGNNVNTDEHGVVIGWLLWIWGMLSTTFYWSTKIATACIAPTIAWTILSILILCRYIGPFYPIGKKYREALFINNAFSHGRAQNFSARCSCIPVRTNPLFGKLHRILRNFTSKSRFLDFIANGLDRLSAPSTPVVIANAKSPTDTKISNENNGRQRTTPVMIAQPFTNTNTTDARLNNVDGIRDFLNNIISSTSARYNRPGLLSMLVQGLAHAAGGCIFARISILTHASSTCKMQYNSGVNAVIVLSCVLAPILELYSNIHESELHYSRYSSFVCDSLLDAGSNYRRNFSLWHILVAMATDMVKRVKQSVLGVAMLSHFIATAAIFLWSRVGQFVPAASPSMHPSLSFSDIMQSLLISYLATIILVSVMVIQDVLTRWAVCASGMDADVLMFQTSKSKGSEDFLVEDLITQSVLMGDGRTVEMVVSPAEIHQPGTMAPFKTLHEDEIRRNELAATSFAQWIEHSSTKSAEKLSVDILRMCILESLGGGGSTSSGHEQSHPFYFGGARHVAAIRRRLDLSAATASPGRQPIVVPIVRALCAFAGGVGDAMSRFYRVMDKNGKSTGRNDTSVELWNLPPGSLNAMQFSIVAAARLVVMNSVIIDKSGHVFVNSVKRNDHLSLLLPCVLQSAFKLRCGINKYAEAKAKVNEVNLSTYDKGGENDGLACFIAAECPDLLFALSACNNSARMAMKTIVELGDRMLEEILLRQKWKGDMQQWLDGLH